ncbi:hypothetical protein [Halovivax limisalsi]|uniref:hypothetical protein n=1 Tax=Halovivax limisalsi TaxID=1453760 RepID=UPI001FFC358E|nr:hypothetical protein [Halovivax limisalsi]
MVSDDIRDDLAAAERTFEESPVTIEAGLDVTDPELVQLRRACRLLAAGSHLRERGYYTVVIESSFVAIGRSIQFRLIHDGAMAPEEIISSPGGSTSEVPRPASTTTGSVTNSPICGATTGRRRIIDSESRLKSRPKRCTASPPTFTTISSRRVESNTNASATRDLGRPIETRSR